MSSTIDTHRALTSLLPVHQGISVQGLDFEVWVLRFSLSALILLPMHQVKRSKRTHSSERAHSSTRTHSSKRTRSGKRTHSSTSLAPMHHEKLSLPRGHRAPAPGKPRASCFRYLRENSFFLLLILFILLAASSSLSPSPPPASATGISLHEFWKSAL